MLTRKLHQTYVEVGKLVKYLLKRDWDRADEISRILEKADREIERIQDKAIADVLVKLQGSYSQEWLAER
jgi:hypothetical protein